MSANPTISVIMGVFNGSDLLSETIDSVLAQTEDEFEFVIVNDGSSDARTGKILAEYARRDGRLRVLSKRNEGLTRALIDGCAVARGPYIARIDVGDMMTPDRLGRQKSVLDALPDVVLVTCWTDYCGPQWEPLYTAKGKFAGALEADCLVADVMPKHRGENLIGAPTSHPSVMFRAAAYHGAGGYRWQFYYGQDWDLWYRLAERGRFALIPAVLYRVRLFPGSISASSHKKQVDTGHCSLGAFWARQSKEDENPWLERAMCIRPSSVPAQGRQSKAGSAYFIGMALRNNDDKRCRDYFWQALRANPLQVKSYLRLAQALLHRQRQ